MILPGPSRASHLLAPLHTRAHARTQGATKAFVGELFAALTTRSYITGPADEEEEEEEEEEAEVEESVAAEGGDGGEERGMRRGGDESGSHRDRRHEDEQDRGDGGGRRQAKRRRGRGGGDDDDEDDDDEDGDEVGLGARPCLPRSSCRRRHSPRTGQLRYRLRLCLCWV